MIIREIEKHDREQILQAFKPILAGWDYLPNVIDSWFVPSTNLVTMVACEANDEFIAMMQIQEFLPKRWFARGLRANPNADSIIVGKAIYALRSKLEKIMLKRGAISVGYRTLETFSESINLASKFNFNEKCRIAHKWYDAEMSDNRDAKQELDLTNDFDAEQFLEYMQTNKAFMQVGGHFFTWWEIRPLTLDDIQQAQKKQLAFVKKSGNTIEGACLLFHVPEIKYLFLSIVEGSDTFIADTYKLGLKQAQKLGCKKIGLIHPDDQELKRRQELLGLESGSVHSILFQKNYRSDV